MTTTTHFYDDFSSAGPAPASIDPTPTQTYPPATQTRQMPTPPPTYRPPTTPQPTLNEKEIGQLASRSTWVIALALIGLPTLFTILGPICTLTAIFLGAKTWRAYKDAGRKPPTRLVAGVAIAALASLFATILVFNVFVLNLIA